MRDILEIFEAAVRAPVVCRSLPEEICAIAHGTRKRHCQGSAASNHLCVTLVRAEECRVTRAHIALALEPDRQCGVELAVSVLDASSDHSAGDPLVWTAICIAHHTF